MASRLAELYQAGLISPRQMAQLQPQDDTANAPYYAEGSADIDRAAMAKQRAGMMPGITRGQDPDVQAGTEMAFQTIPHLLGAVPSLATTAGDFIARHGSDPDWLTALGQEAAPMAASAIGGPLLGRAIAAAPRATAAALGAGGLLASGGETSSEATAGQRQQQPWEAAGVSRAVWDTMSPRAQNNLLIEAGKRAQAEAAVTRSMPPPDRLQQLGVTEAEWRSMTPDERSGLIARTEERERQAQMSFREKNPELSSSIPYGVGAVMGAFPYVNRLRAQAGANRFAREAADNVIAGRTAFDKGDKMGGRYAFERAQQQLKANNPSPPSGVGGWLQSKLGPVASWGGPAAAGGLSTTIPEDIDIGQKTGTPYEADAWNRLLSEAALKRAGVGALATELPAIVSKKAPLSIGSQPFPTADVKSFVKTYKPTVRKLEETESERTQVARSAAFKKPNVRAPE